MNDLTRAVEAADGVWPVLAIFIIGLYVLVWKFGGVLLAGVRKSGTDASDARIVASDVLAETQQISENITTNHGSRNIGHAVDILTEMLVSIRHDMTVHRTELAMHHAELNTTLGEIKWRLETLEKEDDDARTLP